MNSYYLALGSNEGERILNLSRAFEALKSVAEIESSSSIYETEPKYFFEQGKFLNMVCKVKADLSPMQLFEETKEIEKNLGRVETFPNGPRLIDIDLLFSPQESHFDSVLTLPHPRMAERAFVLVPLVEIAPDLELGDFNAQKLLESLDHQLVSEVKLYQKGFILNG